MTELYSKLEFDSICKKIAGLSQSEVCAAEILNTQPVNDITEAQKLLTRTEDAIGILASHRPDLAFDDIAPFVARARVGATLQPDMLLKIKCAISSLRSVKNSVESSDGCDSLKDITAWVRVCDGLERSIDGAISSDASIKDKASDKLYSIRRAITHAGAKLKERLDGYTKRSDISKYLQDNIITLREGRYVVPVKAECRGNVKGLVHDVSSTGSTVFVEPFAIVEANNELRTLRTEEQIEIERILAELSGEVAENARDLTEMQRVLTECGVIFAKAEYAKRTDSYRPTLNTTGAITLKAARHPLIAADKVVPVDISLDDRRVLLISGPNTGGKTVALKTVGLFALMAASGIFLPAAQQSEMCVFDRIFCDIGDSQSIEQSLSTFSAHIKHISGILGEVNERSLVLLDEVGDGTDPEEGAALAIAIIKRLLAKNAVAVVTTHFNSVKEFALTEPRTANACMQFDSVNFRPTYKLVQGASGSSYALEIAERLGLDAGIIADARAALSDEKIAFDTLMKKAEELRNEAMLEKQHIAEEKARAEENGRLAERYKAEYEQKLDDVKATARETVRKSADEYIERADSIIEKIKQQLKAADEQALFTARKLAKELENGVPYDVKRASAASRPALPGELSDGMSVYVSGLEKEGIVVGTPHGNKAIVAIGQIKTELPISSLTIIAEKKRQTAAVDRVRTEPVNAEIMLLGKTVSEATEELDRLLGDIPPHSSLRIVHGKGTGALGKGIQAYLKRHPRIKSFRYGRYGEGDTGVTIVEIK